MKKNGKMLSLPWLIIAITAVLALAAGTVLLYSFSYAPLWMVFVPVGVAVVGSAVVLILNRKLLDVAAILALLAACANSYFLSKHGIESVQNWAWLPTIVLAVVYIVLRDVNATKEVIRKFFVSLKRNPQFIPLAMMFVTFLVYSMNLTDVADTTAKIQGKGMGLSEFAIMLFSLLCMVCMLNAFPRRKKANVLMLILMFAMFAIIVFCDIHYQNAIFAAVSRTENPIKITDDTRYIQQAYDMLGVHMILVIITAALVVLLPVYKKLLKKINTSIALEYGDDMAEIEINE